MPAGRYPGAPRCRRLRLDCRSSIKGEDLPHTGSLHFLSDEEAPVAHIVYIKEVVAETPVEAGAEVAAAPAEPEVIKKGKQETEEAAAEGGEKPEKGKEKSKEKEKK